MNEIYAIKKDTPHVRAIKVNDRIAKYPCEGMPQIYHKEFDLHEFIGEEIAGIRGVNSVHYFPVLFEDIDTVLSMNIDFFRFGDIAQNSARGVPPRAAQKMRKEVGVSPPLYDLYF